MYTNSFCSRINYLGYSLPTSKLHVSKFSSVDILTNKRDFDFSQTFHASMSLLLIFCFARLVPPFGNMHHHRALFVNKV
jgi:hypothetical protein